jgi:hypothetical protein
MEPEQGQEPTLGELFEELSRGAQTLIRQEVELAKTEMSQKLSSLARDVAFLAIGAFIVYAGFLALIAALIFGLATVMPAWAAALLVGLIVLAAGAALIMRGQENLKRRDMTPRQTIATLKEDAEWMKEQVT